MKRIFFILVIFFISLNPAFSKGENGKYKIATIVIDPGHGGKDSGCRGKFSMEKDLVLKISLKLGEYIEKNFPDVKVIYTRKTDVFIPLYQRAKIANENEADLFISVHINANTSTRPYGAETYVMGLHKSNANLQVAKAENASILYEENYEEQYGGYDPNAPEANIIFSLYQNIFLDQSLQLASHVQENFGGTVGFKDRGVKQAGFLVLWKTTMPGILVEAGFLSNPKEEKFLNNEENLDKIALSIFKAFKEYKTLLEGRDEGEDISSFDENMVKIDSTDHFSRDENKNQATEDENIENTHEEEVYFTVQIGTSLKKRPANSPEFKGLQGVDYYMHNGIYKYTVGKEKSLEAATKLQRKVHEAGIKDAFVIAFQGKKRITPGEAIKLL